MAIKTIIVVLVGLAVVSVHLADAQQPTRIPRIGYVSGTGDATNQGPYVEALRQGLRDLGYVEGKNFVIEYRGAEGKSDRMASLVTDLVELKVDVLVVPTTETSGTAKQATKTMPIVMVTPGDPVAAALIDSLARPGGNITGLSTLSQELIGKRLELLKEVVPRLSRVGILLNLDAAGAANSVKDHETAANSLKIQTQSLDTRGPNPDLEGAFRAAVKGRVGALITVTSGPLFVKQKRIAELAIKNRLPSLYQGRVVG
jgi:putative ABC transport system substrate-binding protein